MRTNESILGRVGTLCAGVVLATGLVAAQGTQPTSPMGSQSQSPSNNPGAMSPNNPNNPANSPMAQGSDQHMDMGAKNMSKTGDQGFAIKAAQGGMAEVMTGKLAAEKASDPDVKAFGQMMVDDHTKANDQLKSVAAQKGMTLPTSTDPKHQAIYDKLSKMSGADFDKTYIKDMVKDHEEDVKEFQKESTKGKDPQIKEFATQTLPVIQGHLDKAKSLQGKMSSTTSTK